MPLMIRGITICKAIAKDFCSFFQTICSFSTPPHNLGEIKHLLREWTFGLGDINVPKVRSICIAGPPGCGKKLMAYGLIRELGRRKNYFFISAERFFIDSCSFRRRSI